MEMQVPQLLHSLARLRVPLLSLAIAFSLCNLLRVMEVVFCLALLPLVQIVAPGHPWSRKVAKRRAISPCETPQRLAWLTSFMRPAPTPVRPLTPHVLRDAVSRLGSASLSLLLLGCASDCTPELRRWLLGRRLWLVVPNLFRRFCLLVRVATRLLTNFY